jgi:hypothetical protein
VPRCCVESWVSARVSESKNISESNNECMNRWVREWLTWCHAAALNLERVQEWVRVKGWARRAMSVRLTGNTPCFTYLQVWCRDFEHECMSGNTPCFRFVAGTLSMNGNTPCFTYLQLWWLLALLTFRFGAGTLSSQYTTPGGTIALRRDSSPSLQFDLHYRYTHTCTNTVSSVFIDLRCTHVDVQVQMSI